MGIIGAVLLAASLLSKTMIVVLGLLQSSLEPFRSSYNHYNSHSKSTTGDLELIVETMHLLWVNSICKRTRPNVLALYIVRKYREYYE